MVHDDKLISNQFVTGVDGISNETTVPFSEYVDGSDGCLQSDSKGQTVQ